MAREDGPPVSAAFLLMTLGRRVRDEVEAGLRAEAMSLRHLSALGHLASGPGLSYSELARRAGVTPQSMQATLNALEARGAVVRVTHPGRGRRAELHVTDEGERLRGVGRGILAAIDDRIAEQLPDEAATAVTQALLALMRAPGV
ncbi:MarR family winged helix-turn-helix transcriptional regulator [Actinomycetospora termitidis]|uniref:MarR family winged helix-turn-helix transcriptional regulator n=1 Tax=Actinomycetospora termitidis TaxID=3053470 RepID=A0ABT7MGG9_9PSEU|nr:MarR family winged helix-turn-helix transcriptional regulator [Actinomycetospora sp. Odt1-22]MDL5159771.1 MarR family winged helix-turn-helix transcriptional regulator [Actinomycetospora sp. Odt1-22]